MQTPHTITNPYDDEIVASVKLIDREEVEQAIERSVSEFEKTRKIPAYRRAELLRALAEAVRVDSERFAHAIMRESGKPITLARGEVQRAVATLNGSADEATRINGETLSLDTASSGAGRFGITRRFPIGPIAGISPFNFPLNLGMHKVGPALASGNTILWKPPLQAPGAALLFLEHFQRIATQQDFSMHALQVVLCDDSAAEMLATDSRIKLLSFTGSARVGWSLRAKAGIKRVVFELGGNAAVVIAEDADHRLAAKRCAEGGFGYSGQTCIAVQRIIVHESIYDIFQEELVSQVKALKSGDPADSATQVGPMVSAKEADRVEAWIAEALKAGATLLCGGERNGLSFTPAVFTDVHESMRIVGQEVFGPVVTLQTYKEWKDALAMVNNSVYGLQAGIYTNDIRRIMQAFETIQAGAVIVNDVPTLRIDSMPYGGVKESGTGREGMRYAIEDMTEERLLVM